MDKRMIINHYQEELAERSLVVEPVEDGEHWEFRWYIDPIANGLAKWQHYSVRVSDGFIAYHGVRMPKDPEEVIAMGQAMDFVKRRYERVGLNEENTEGGD